METSLVCSEKIEFLTKQLKGMGKIALAFSGGLDSAFLLACSKQMGHGNWDLPSQSCLATRIPYNDLITQEKLDMIGRGLKKIGFEYVSCNLDGYKTGNINKFKHE